MIVNCAYCGKEIKRFPCELIYSHSFCSLSCRSKFYCSLPEHRKKIATTLKGKPGKLINLELNENLAYIVGVVLGDGWVGYNHHGFYTVGMTSIDYPFIKNFQLALERIGLRVRAHPYKNKNPNGHNGWVLSAYSKEFYHWWFSLNWESKRSIAISYPKSFLRGIYESEGTCFYYHSRRLIKIVNKNKNVADIIRESMQVLDFHPKGHCDARGYYYVGLYRWKEVERFFELIDPCIKRGENRK